MRLLAVIGPARNDQRCRDRSLRRTYLPTIPCACHQAWTSRSSAGKSIFEGTGLNVGMNALQENENRPPHLGRTGSSAVPPSVRAAHPEHMQRLSAQLGTGPTHIGSDSALEVTAEAPAQPTSVIRCARSEERRVGKERRGRWAADD